MIKVTEKGGRWTITCNADDMEDIAIALEEGMSVLSDDTGIREMFDQIEYLTEGTQ